MKHKKSQLKKLILNKKFIRNIVFYIYLLNSTNTILGFLYNNFYLLQVKYVFVYLYSIERKIKLENLTKIHE